MASLPLPNDDPDHTERWFDSFSDSSHATPRSSLPSLPPETNRVDLLEQRLEEMEHCLRGVEARLSYLVTENLKLVNRVLEAEIALERARNSLVRQHIPFPFTPSRLEDEIRGKR